MAELLDHDLAFDCAAPITAGIYYSDQQIEIMPTIADRDQPRDGMTRHPPGSRSKAVHRVSYPSCSQIGAEVTGRSLIEVGSTIRCMGTIIANLGSMSQRTCSRFARH
jgi:hypothetical protein